MTDLLTKEGEPKLVEECTYPLTAMRCVSRVFTGHGQFRIVGERFAVVETYGEATVPWLREVLGLNLIDVTNGGVA